MENLKNEKIEEFAKGLQDEILSSLSYFDTEKDEKYYKIFLIGIFIILENDYIRLSERESGYGRADLVLEPKNKINPNARILIHQPAMEGVQGQASDIEIVADEIDRMRTWLEETLASHTGQDVEKVHRDLERDKILTAVAAKEYGIVDQVLVSRKTPPSPHSA